jgi:hypothetical protein
MPYLDTIRVYFPGGHWSARWTFDKLSLSEVPTEALGVKCTQIRYLQQSLGAYKGDPPVRITTARSEGQNGTVYGGTLVCMATTLELEPVHVELVDSLRRIIDDAAKTPVDENGDPKPLLTSLCANGFYLADIGTALTFNHKHPSGAARVHGNLQIRNGTHKYDPLYITVSDRNALPNSGLIEAILMPVVE